MPIFWSLMPPTPSLNRLETVNTGVTPKNVMGVELAARAEVEKLAIFHHDPNATDENISEFCAYAVKFLTGSWHAVANLSPVFLVPHPHADSPEVLFAYDGLTTEL